MATFSNNQRVVITGIGMLTPLGLTTEASFTRALQGQSSITTAPAAVTRWLPHALAAGLDDSYSQHVQKNEVGLDKATQLALIASRAALADADSKNFDIAAERIGVYTGIGFGGANTLDALYARFYEQVQVSSDNGRSPIVVHPLSVPRLMPNAASAAISMANQFRGSTHTYSVACASSAMALGEAYRSIRHGYADAIVIVGAEAMNTPGCFVAWNALRVMAKPYSRQQVENLAASCRPFDQARSGFVLGEGATALVLESAKSALRRKVKIYGELCGYGSSSDANHITLPSREGQCRAMQMALNDAGMKASDIHYLNAHGTATEAGDVVESEAIVSVFADHTSKLPVSSTKSVHGHLIGAAGAVEFALSLLAMQSGSIPPTAHLDNPDPRCALDHVPHHPRHGQHIHAIMSNSFAFGGSNVSLIARQFQ